jgi:rhamnosyltransferase
MIKKQAICAVVVSYNPDVSIIDNVIALLPQVSTIVIVDNGSSETSIEYLDHLKSEPCVHLILNKDNLGIAVALNLGVKYAIKAGYSWIATFDQDSKVLPNYISLMISAYNSCNYKSEVAIISPTYFIASKEKIVPSTINNDEEHLLFSNIKTAMTSGNIIKSSTFNEIGFFDEGFFIDYVDHEFCLRVRKHGKFIIECNNAILDHNLGSPILYNIFGFKIVTNSHTALRKYYRYRNRIMVYKKYFLFDFPWILNDLKNFFSEPFKIILLEEDKFNKFCSILRGIWHGIKNVSGKYNSRK